MLTIRLHCSTTYNSSPTQFQECSDDYASFLNEPESIRWQFVRMMLFMLGWLLC
jgi:hypothetical protein